eukprot:2942776-Prymnesium_polylepis.3
MAARARGVWAAPPTSQSAPSRLSTESTEPQLKKSCCERNTVRGHPPKHCQAQFYTPASAPYGDPRSS